MSEEIKWCIYCHTNKINGKKYIGLTKQSVNRRWRNGNGYKKQLVFYNAIQKYGWDNFEHEVLNTNLTKESAIQLEIEYISTFHTLVPSGYNSTTGGECFEATDELKQRMSLSRKNIIPHNLHLLHTPEVRAKISNSLTGKSNNATSKKIICDNTYFNSITECEDYYGIKNGCMGSWLNHSRPMPQKFYNMKLRYAHEEFNNDVRIQKGFPKGGESYNAKRVFCITTGEKFESIKEASDKYHVSSSSIILVCKKDRNSAGMYIGKKLKWMYYEDYIKEKGGLAIEI